MSNISLYGITNKFTELFEKAENEELTQEEFEQQGNELAVMLQNKSTSIVGYYRDNESVIDSVKNEIDRLTAIKKLYENRNERFKKYVKENMERLELEKIETPIGIISIRKGVESVKIEDESLIPDEFMRIKKEVDKTAIKKYLKEDEKNTVQGVSLAIGDTSLMIK